METNPNHWGEFLSNWPADVSRHGIVVTTFNEQILFSTFWTSGNFLMLERQTPDSQGARTLILPYEQILALKMVDLIKPKSFKAAGFEGPPSKY
jgi:hypothetical protein